MSESCRSCPRECAANRVEATGLCRAPDVFTIASYCLHRGEEPVISGERGSGTIFFSHCNLRCVYCQNYDISHEGMGDTTTDDELIAICLQLQKQGAHNINFVSPSHYAYRLPHIIRQAKKCGLDVPIVYNTNAYDGLFVLKELEGLVDIYMPDLKYANNAHAHDYSACPNYVEHAHAAITEMHRQTGAFTLNDDGIAMRGVLVRHLVLPNSIAGSKECVDFLTPFASDIFLSVMSQYSPQYQACRHPQLNRCITQEEYQDVVAYAQQLPFKHIFIQEHSSQDTYLPHFEKEDHPFE